MTSDQTPAQRKRTARIAASTAAVVLVVACFLGDMILEFFGISMASFRIAAGILLLLMALSMLHAKQSPSKHTPEEAEDAASRDNVAVVPLAIPLMTGPAAMSTVIIYAHKATSLFDTGFIIASSLATALIAWIALRMASRITVWLGKTGMNVAVRVMGLLLAAIAVEFITSGLGQVFPSLVSAGKG